MSTTSASEAYVDDNSSWDSFHLDARLVQAIDQLGFEHPTLIQASAIPLALEEKRDIIAKASFYRLWKNWCLCDSNHS